MMCKGCIFYPYKTPTSLFLVDEEERSRYILLPVLQYQCSMKCLQSLVPYGIWYMSIQYAFCVSDSWYDLNIVYVLWYFLSI